MSSTKKPGVGSFLEGLLQKIPDIQKAMSAQLESLGVRISNKPPSIALSDKRLVGDAQAMATRLVPKAEIRIEPRPTGFIIGGLLDGKRVSALVELESVGYSSGQVHVLVRTPEAVNLEGQRLTQLFAGVVAGIFGGTDFAREALSAKLPKQVRWDGKKAEITVELDREQRLPKELLAMDVTAAASRADGWTTFQMHQSGAITALGSLFVARLAKWSST